MFNKFDGLANHIGKTCSKTRMFKSFNCSFQGGQVFRCHLLLRSVIYNTGMTTEDCINALAAWLANAGLRGEPEDALVSGFCERAVATDRLSEAVSIAAHVQSVGKAFTER